MEISAKASEMFAYICRRAGDGSSVGMNDAELRTALSVTSAQLRRLEGELSRAGLLGVEHDPITVDSQGTIVVPGDLRDSWAAEMEEDDV